MNAKRYLTMLSGLLLFALICAQAPLQVSAAAPLVAANATSAAPGGSCHFGIATLIGGANGYDLNLDRYDLSILGVGSYLDWGLAPNPSVSQDLSYYRVINTGGDSTSFNTSLSNLPKRFAANPGGIWLIGNEPDSQVTYQDHLTAEVYAERYFAVATAIRQSDPSAKIGFGTVIQPSPVRMYYLNKVIARMTQLAGSRANALSLIDVYSIHAFILNEENLYDANGKTISWGAGLPLGYDAATWPAPQVISGYTPAETINIATFKAGIQRFRQWMKSIGDQNKPLWITEYGSLFPTFLSITEDMSATYMEQTFDYLLGTKDATLGYPDDENRLVQKFVWYSLNDRVNHFGGSLYDPATGLITAVGTRFINYNPDVSLVPVSDSDVYIMGAPVYAAGKITLKVGNTVSTDRLTGVQVNVYQGSTLVGSATANLPRCAGNTTISVDDLNSLLAGADPAYVVKVSILAGNGNDTNLINNTFVSSGFPYRALLPISQR